MVVVVTAWLPASANARSHSTVRSMGMYSGLTRIFARETNGCGRMATHPSCCCIMLSTSSGLDLNSRLNVPSSPFFASSASMVYSGVPPSP